MRSGNGLAEETPGLESVLKLRLMALLTDMVRSLGMGGTAKKLGVSRQTMWRATASGTLPPSLLAALERWVRDSDDAAASDLRDTAEALGSRVSELEGKLEEGLRQVNAARTAIEEQSEGAAEGLARHLGEVERRLAHAETALREGRMAPRDGDVAAEARQGVVSLKPGPDEDEAYGDAAPLVAEWRRLYGGGVDEGGRVERAMAEERMRGLEIDLIEDHGLTLPPATYPWTEGERRSEVRSRRMTLDRVRAERIRAQWRRRILRILAAGLWR